MHKATVMTFAVLLGSCSIASAQTFAPQEYNRRDWKHWVDEDGDCQDARQEVLIEESSEPVVLDDRGCRVESGVWVDPYTAKTFTDPSLLDVDHVVALRDAHDSGGDIWTPELRKMFANDMADPAALRAVYRSANRSKGSRGPDRWLPTNADFRCQYIEEYMAIKEKWILDSDEHQKAVIGYMRKMCDDGIAPPLPQ